ncbi:formylglycine-generating enzyme family protein [Methylovulum psychrotolerans]|uniref:Serine/threonine-protein kinase pkn1 n=1 Tax=Methylovulum psychrotolerans TaxID=1704499 RepID=A0A2S5CPS9_9GAMM|nr:formylglycine-generating enzyme family protein [Methylovulum psychrotolerans]POZ52820.1 Serine/threonine-protein kinase pkn1 [Methylovulum psychrotolerans]
MIALVSRADLVACLKDADRPQLVGLAAALGYGLFEQAPEPVTPPTLPDVLDIDEAVTVEEAVPAPVPPQNPKDTAKTQGQFLRVVAQQSFADDDEAEADKAAVQYLDRPAPPALQAPEGYKPPEQPPLMAWNRLWPFLKMALGADIAHHKPDMPRVINTLAKGKPLRRLPKVKRKGWASQVQLIMDYDPALVPFSQDFNALKAQLSQVRGVAGLQVLALPTGDPSGPYWQATPTGWRPLDYYPWPAPGTQVLVLSDLGCNGMGEQRRVRWRRFGAQLARTAGRVWALMPCPPRYWDAQLCGLFCCVYWDRGVRPPQGVARYRVYPAADTAGGRDEGAAECLLSLLAIAVRVEPALLRAARLLFPAAAMDVGTEFAVWNHPAVQAGPLAFYLQAGQVRRYREQFRTDARVTPALQQQISGLLAQHHAALSPVITYEEQCIYAELTGDALPETARQFAQWLVETVQKPHEGVFLAAKQWSQRMGGRQHPSLWQNKLLAGAWVVANPDVPLPEGLSLENLAGVIKGPVLKSYIYQRGQGVVFAASASEASGSLVGEISHQLAQIQVEGVAEAGAAVSRLYGIGQTVPLQYGQALLIRSDREELRLDWCAKPSWAEAMGRDGFGLYADWQYKDVVQRFRWLNPGRFLMGSPPDEVDRRNSEVQHLVTLTDGFWLADTTVTQALWLAVMGNNPSKFKDNPANPVETVSWQDAQVFIDKLKGLESDLAGQLPSEAQWEYACRAGTATPFSFGANITPEQVNYDGNFPYAGGEKGLYRGQTVQVKTLPPNPWGLYEMHGNVWEWCADVWQEQLPAGGAVNPFGAEGETDALRVVRGGSWDYVGGDVRSAIRSRDGPDNRDYSIGLRLALGHPELRSSQVAAGGVSGRRVAEQRQTEAIPDTDNKTPDQIQRLASWFRRNEK